MWLTMKSIYSNHEFSNTIWSGSYSVLIKSNNWETSPHMLFGAMWGINIFSQTVGDEMNQVLNYIVRDTFENLQCARVLSCASPPFCNPTGKYQMECDLIFFDIFTFAITNFRFEPFQIWRNTVRLVCVVSPVSQAAWTVDLCPWAPAFHNNCLFSLNLTLHAYISMRAIITEPKQWNSTRHTMFLCVLVPEQSSDRPAGK